MDSMDIMVDDDMLLDDFDISALSLIGMDTKQEAGNIQQLDNNETNFSQFYDLENGEMFAKIEKNMAAMGEEIGGLRAENGDMKNVYGQIKEEMGEMKKAFDGLNEKVGKLAEENGELKAKLAGNGGALENIVKGIAELKALIGAKNVEFGENFHKMEEFKGAFEALEGATNDEEEKAALEGKIAGLLKRELEGKMRNINEQQQMAANKEAEMNASSNFIQLKENKWNLADCGTKMAISAGEELVAKHSSPLSPTDREDGYSGVRAIWPIPPLNFAAKKPSIAFYFEVQILSQKRRCFIHIGFCSREFPMDIECLGRKNSIGFFDKRGIKIDGNWIDFGNDGWYFSVGEVIGMGIMQRQANSSPECFATSNGKLLGTAKLPSKFVSLQLFPSVTLHSGGDSLRANFGQQKWHFNPTQLVQQEN